MRMRDCAVDNVYDFFLSCKIMNTVQIQYNKTFHENSFLGNLGVHNRDAQTNEQLLVLVVFVLTSPRRKCNI